MTAAEQTPADQSLQGTGADQAWHAVANQMFFRLYQCANMLHKTGTKAVEREGLTTQRWAVLGALTRPESASGIAVGDLARHLRVSRQSLAGVIGRLEDDGLIAAEPDPTDRRSRLLRLTSAGERKWHEQAQPLIHAFYDDAARGLSLEDMSHTLHYLTRLIDNMSALDESDI